MRKGKVFGRLGSIASVLVSVEEAARVRVAAAARSVGRPARLASSFCGAAAGGFGPLCAAVAARLLAAILWLCAAVLWLCLGLLAAALLVRLCVLLVAVGVAGGVGVGV